MKIIYDPEDMDDPGRPIEAPAILRRLAVPKLDALCSAYRFGETLQQEYECTHFNLRFLFIHTNKGGHIYLSWYSHVVLLQYPLDGALVTENSLADEPTPCHHLRVIRHTSLPLILPSGLSGHMFLELKKNLRQSLSSALPEIGIAIQDKQMQYHSPAIPSNYKIAEVLRKLKYEDTDYDFTPFPRLTPALQLLNEFTEGYRKAIHSDPSLSFPYKDALISIRNEILYAPNIRRHTAANLSVKYAISASTLWKEFHDTFRTTLTAFVQKTAMEKARLLLMTTTIPIHVIARDIGYSHVGNFSRAFRRYFNILPQQMRFRTGFR